MIIVKFSGKGLTKGIVALIIREKLDREIWMEDWTTGKKIEGMNG